MKRFLPLLFLPCLFILAGYSSGVASTTDSGYTGAPSAGGGMESTCSTCHSSGSYGTPTLSATFDERALTTYRPGQTYRVTIAVTPGSGEPAGYGFQAQFLDASTPIAQPAGTLDMPGDFAAIVTTNQGRTYAEHNRKSTDSLFSFNWTAPEAGTGPVSLYAVGNTINDNGGTSGDNGSEAPLIVELIEDTSTSTNELQLALESVFPNPTRDKISMVSPYLPGGVYRFDLFTADGRRLDNYIYEWKAGARRFEVNLSYYPHGMYILRASGPEGQAVTRIIKR